MMVDGVADLDLTESFLTELIPVRFQLVIFQ